MGGNRLHRSNVWAVRAGVLSIAAILLVSARSALGVPAFARKYGTSCLTCHTIYPKLNPFGEAFRRNGYRFPGVDSDFVKQDTVPLGQDAYKKEFPHSVWPGTLPGSVPLALGFNGQAVVHPNRNAGGAAADNGARLNLNDLIEEGHIWAGGSFDDQITRSSRRRWTSSSRTCPPFWKMSLIQSSQMAMSGGIMPEKEPVPLFRMKNPSGICWSVSETTTESMRESGGPRETSATNSSNRSPRAKISTSLPRFFTVPEMPRAQARA